MIEQNSLIEIGKFRKTHALKGELNALLEVSPQYFDEGNPLIVNIDGIFVPFYSKSVREKGSTTYLIQIEGINSEKEASVFVNKEIYMLRKDAEIWLDDEDLLTDDSDQLLGYTIIDRYSKIKVGIIQDIDTTTSNILFLVDNGSESPIYIPASENLIEEIDDENKTIYMNLPEGLLEINVKKNDK